jgi:biopolymer transport protein ExbB
MSKIYRIALIFAFLGAGATPLFGADASNASTSSSVVAYLHKGGPVLYVLILLSFVMLCLVFYYLMSLRTVLVVPDDLVKRIEGALEKKDFELLAEISKKDDSPTGKIIKAGTEIFIRSKNNYVMIRDAVEDEGGRQSGILWQRIQPLQDIAIIAPMVGLLGTVIGMINSFMSLTAEVGTPRPTVIANGVSMALITTAAGLIIGITAMILYSYFRSRIHNIIGYMENVCNKIALEMMVSDSGNDVPF